MSNFYDFLEQFNELASLLKGSEKQCLQLGAMVCPFDAVDAFGHRLDGDLEKRQAILFERENGEKEIAVITRNGMVPSVLCQIFAGEDGVTFVSARAYEVRNAHNQRNYSPGQYSAGEISEGLQEDLAALSDFHSEMYCPKQV